MAARPGRQHPRVLFQAPEGEEPPQRRLGKCTIKYNRKDLQRRLDIEEWIETQLHFLFDCDQEEEIPELEIDIDELLDLPDSQQRAKLNVQLQRCSKPTEDFVSALLYRIKGLRKMSAQLRK